MTSTQTIATVSVITAGNGTVDLAARVDMARRAKGNSPFVGIATERGTVMLRRDVLKKSLAGLRVIDAELVAPGDRGTDRHHGMIRGSFRDDTGELAYYRAPLAIRVYAVGERVKSTRLYTHQPWKIGSGVLHPLLEAWQRANMRKWGVCDCYEFDRRKTCKHIETATRPKPDKYERAIAKLEKEMPREWRPGNPAVAAVMARPVAGDDERRQWQEWRLQKSTRRAVMSLARRGAKDMNSTQIYAEVGKLTTECLSLANERELLNAMNSGAPTTEWPARVYELVSRPVVVRKWGEIGARERERTGLENLFDYMGKLWEFCGLTGKPGGRNGYEYATVWGPERYRQWLQDLHLRKQLRGQIAAIRAEQEGAKSNGYTNVR